MPQYSQEEAAGLLGQLLVKVNERLDAIEARPARDRFSREVERGRERARAAGYNGAALAELEQFMVNEGISKHHHAIALQPDRPSAYLGAQDDADFKALIESGGDDQAVTRRMINTALAEVRAADDY